MASNELYDKFVQASGEAAKDLNLNPESLKFTRAETSKIGLDYVANIEIDGKGFSFHIRVNSETADVTSGSMTASMSITYAKELEPYYFFESFPKSKDRPHEMVRWVSWAIFNYRLEHQKANLKTLFGGMDIHIYGVPGYGGEDEAELLLNGMLSMHEGKAIVYRFRHIEKENFLMRRISYAIFAAPKNRGGLWLVFPDCSGLDSGGSHITYETYEALLSKLAEKFDVEINNYDIQYDDFERFLLKNAFNFDCILRRNVLKPYSGSISCPRVLQESEAKFEKLVEKFQQENYSESLRDLRALVQQAQENILKTIPSYKITPKANIHGLAQDLVTNNKLDGRLLPLFTAFHTVASEASHKDFPSEEQMMDSILIGRVVIIIYLGLQLLEELDSIVYPKILIDGKEPDE